ncbi:hypothetical protein EDD66_10539 [Mobilisporobacter senegalensis]|uniref:Uncharacterized protein n=1 Tax=Mobilisporobacter senegalensis TaxID=1329262 RepID=A0A3N1XPL0_9FIRM|nr:hypothetical protein [Mobilisporobacter senegalensis]ROR28101.1 hypothetical protein EDD66_10539 [Mobilisporobacter senegalensis]
MSILAELKHISELCEIPVETGVFSGVPPDIYLVITPLIDLFEVHADNRPGYEMQEARLSLFVKGSYTTAKNLIVHTLLGADFTITDRRYIGHEDDTEYHHYAIDVAKLYEFQLETEE